MIRMKLALGLAMSLGVLLSAAELRADQLSISNVSLTDPNTSIKTVKVEFDIAWSDSWRTTTNWDAVWVFVKYSTNSGLNWAHATLRASGTNPSGVTGGTGTDLDVVVPADLKGAFFQRADVGLGAISNTDARLVWDFGTDSIASTTSVMVRVFGMEMVYVPTHSFILGDLVAGASTSSISGGSLFTGVAPPQSTLISTSLVGDWHATVTGSSGVDDGTMGGTAVAGIGIDGDGGLDTDDNGAIDNANFPTGYLAFYAMKHELTQMQYRDFLNTLSTAMHVSRTATATLSSFSLTASAGVTNRQGIRNPSAAFSTAAQFGCDFTSVGISRNSTNDGQGIACNYLTWPDILAVADWAALRPMTELEFEKTGKGTSSVTAGGIATASGGGTGNLNVYQFAFGQTSAIEIPRTSSSGSVSTLFNSGTSSEYADQTNMNSGTLSSHNGPVRVGSYAYGGAISNSPTYNGRIKAGTSFYGLYELSGNLAERVVTIGNSTGRAFRGSHGDGMLTTVSSFEGNASNTDWPGIDATTGRGVTGTTGSMYKGGSWGDTFTAGPTTSRQSIADRGDTMATGRSRYAGGRLVRTA